MVNTGGFPRGARAGVTVVHIHHALGPRITGGTETDKGADQVHTCASVGARLSGTVWDVDVAMLTRESQVTDTRE